MVQSKRFTRLKGSDGETSPNLYVANCGPAVGLSFETIASLFGRFGEVRGVSAADESGARVIVSYFEPASAQSALKALHGHPCPDLGGRLLHIRYSVLEQHPQPSKVPTDDSISVSSVASELGIPGIHLVHDFITADEEQALLAAVDERPWKRLAKRRVQHYGYEFLYETRNVDAKQFLGELPLFVSPILEKISLFSNPESVESNIVDQLTVNEYPFGVGLSPHIDTHSAFEGSIFSLSLAGPCIMELRKYPQGTWLPLPSTSIDVKGETSECSNFIRRAIFLPPRSMLSLSGEARYAWHHYIPHHKIDIVGGRTIKRNSRRVSFTLRQKWTLLL
ncbi:alkylated DNA repair protein ALKBH8 homolog isoform X2 [Magnolia sinica]|uniref:alkylated DNA repair protein ALKBH8 homolog isoform X2 n=1 Tax=Magnolia sinica TaxID=86752 RepID=UPI00265AF621|nr:alkylated DNA repair protein ALKBH8 homolog isoform X2 [Magnolia sinica]